MIVSPPIFSPHSPCDTDTNPPPPLPCAVFARHYVVDEDTGTVPVGYNTLQLKRSDEGGMGKLQLEPSKAKAVMLGLALVGGCMGVELVRRLF